MAFALSADTEVAMAYKRRSKKVNNSQTEQPAPGSTRPIEKEVVYGSDHKEVHEQWESETAHQSTLEREK
jgi:hypothetical protein